MTPEVKKGSISEREQAFSTKVHNIAYKRLPFPLDTERGNRSRLRFGDVIVAENKEDNSRLGLLVSKGKGWGARCTPLFYLQDETPVEVEGIDFHNPHTILKPRIDPNLSAFKPMDHKGHQYIYQPTDIEIRRPTDRKLQELATWYETYDRNTRWLFRLGLILSGISAGDGIHQGVQTLGEGGSGEGVLFQLSTGVTGVMALLGSYYFNDKRNEVRQAQNVKIVDILSSDSDAKRYLTQALG